MALRMDRLGVHRTMITAQSTGEMRFLERIKISPEPRFTFARRVTLERLADIKAQADPAARLADHIVDGAPQWEVRRIPARDLSRLPRRSRRDGSAIARASRCGLAAVTRRRHRVPPGHVSRSHR